MFDPRAWNVEPGTVVAEDDLRSVELGVVFRWLQCFRCDRADLYRILVQQVRRHDEPRSDDAQGPPEQRLETWQAMPRFAEIAETVKCKHCGEVIGVYPLLIY
ncbi:MAG: hypothetical protein Kow00109_19280 [Acidobacteriota bacterium]